MLPKLFLTCFRTSLTPCPLILTIPRRFFTSESLSKPKIQKPTIAGLSNCKTPSQLLQYIDENQCNIPPTSSTYKKALSMCKTPFKSPATARTIMNSLLEKEEKNDEKKGNEPIDQRTISTFFSCISSVHNEFSPSEVYLWLQYMAHIPLKKPCPTSRSAEGCEFAQAACRTRNLQFSRSLPCVFGRCTRCMRVFATIMLPLVLLSSEAKSSRLIDFLRGRRFPTSRAKTHKY